jgi:hypothetical protein
MASLGLARTTPLGFNHPYTDYRNTEIRAARASASYQRHGTWKQRNSQSNLENPSTRLELSKRKNEDSRVTSQGVGSSPPSEGGRARATAEGVVSASTSVVSNDTASSTAAPPAAAQVLVAVHGLPGSPPDPDAAIARSSCLPPRGIGGGRLAHFRIPSSAPSVRESGAGSHLFF